LLNTQCIIRLLLNVSITKPIIFNSGSGYVTTYSGHYVETDDFKRCLERESGLNLTKFFDQWIYGKGYPKLKATMDILEPSAIPFAGGRGAVQLTLEQTQGSKAAGVANVFEMMIEIDVVDTEGHVHASSVYFNDLSGPRVVAVIPLPVGVKAAFVEVDPRGKCLFSLDFTPSEQVLGAMATQGRDIGSRVSFCLFYLFNCWSTIRWRS
jgi:aminopeptidase N